MFKKLIERVRNLVDDPVSFDPASLDDPVAMQTVWTPAKSGGANFQTHKLVAVDSHRMEFRASMGARLFYLVFLLIGLGVLVSFSFSKSTTNSLLFGLTFTGIGGALFYFGTAPIVFDKRNGFFWKGRKAPDSVFDKRPLQYVAELGQIHALQIISQYIQGNKGSYYSYELNLVLRDGQRINVVDHGDLNKLRDDAASLSGFLEKPVWDAIQWK